MKTPAIPIKKPCEGFLIFTIDLPYAIASDVTHVIKSLMSELDGKTRKQTTELSKIPHRF